MDKKIVFDFILYVPVNTFIAMSGQIFLGRTSTKQGLMCLASRHNTVAAREARNCNHSISIQTLYHWAPK